VGGGVSGAFVGGGLVGLGVFVGLGVGVGGDGVSDGVDECCDWSFWLEAEDEPAVPEMGFLFLSTWPHLGEEDSGRQQPFYCRVSSFLDVSALMGNPR
jgi:hypothetical protein